MKTFLNRTLALALFMTLSYSGFSQGLMQWVVIPPTGQTDMACTTASDCATDLMCYGLEYTPAYTGVLTSYTTGFFADCTSLGIPTTTNMSCVMNDNSETIDGCADYNLVLFNSSGNTGDAVNNNVVAGTPVILHHVCFTVPSGETVTITEDDITDLTTSIDDVDGSFPTDFPDYTPFTIDRDAECMAFPVEFLSFEAKANKGVSELFWATATEENNSHFDIEWSTDGKSWQEIGRELGAGFSTEVVKYDFTHDTPAKGVNYYRLRQVDVDGAFEFSGVRSVTHSKGRDVSTSFNVSYYPNPTEGIMNVTVEQGNMNSESYYQIVDLNGRVLQKISDVSSSVLDVQSLLEGVYYIQVVNNGEIIDQDRFVKMN